MSSPTNNSGLRDNHSRGTVADFLRAKLQSNSKLSVVSAYFTIYAYDALKEVLDRIEHLDFLFGESSFVNRLDPNKTEKKSFIIDADGLELANKLQQKRVAKECADWISGRWTSRPSSNPTCSAGRSITLRRQEWKMPFSAVPISQFAASAWELAITISS